MSRAVYLWAVFVCLSRVFAYNEQTASFGTIWRIQILPSWLRMQVRASTIRSQVG